MLGGRGNLNTIYKDGWTVTGGIGHAFSETISGVVGLTWDRGVSTTEDTLSDSYTAAAGVSIKDKLGGEVRFGGAISYLTSASVSAEAQPSSSRQIDPGASFAYTVDGDFGLRPVRRLQDRLVKPLSSQKARQCRAFFMPA